MKRNILLFTASVFCLLLAVGGFQERASAFTETQKRQMIGFACEDCKDGGKSCDIFNFNGGPCSASEAGDTITSCPGTSGKTCGGSKNSSECSSGDNTACADGVGWTCTGVAQPNSDVIVFSWKKGSSGYNCGEKSLCDASGRVVNDPDCAGDEPEPPGGE